MGDGGFSACSAAAHQAETVSRIQPDGSSKSAIGSRPGPGGNQTAPWLSRLLVFFFAAWIGGFVLFAVIKSRSPRPGVRSVVSPLKPWDGTWEGELTLTDTDGEIIARFTALRKIRHVKVDDHFRQEGHFETTDLSTHETEAEQVVITIDPDGANLRRQLLQDNGRKLFEFTGRIENGTLLWSRGSAGSVHSIREWIENGEYRMEEMRSRSGVGTGRDAVPLPARANADGTESVRLEGRFRRVEGE